MEVADKATGVSGANPAHFFTRGRRALFFAVLALSVAFVIVGAVSGECSIVLSKATRVCLECIGIG